MAETGAGFRCGLVALAGRPNVGKSTLLNRLLGQKIAIVSPRPQTTRHRLHGIVTNADGQAVYIDAPGLHLGERNALNRRMNRIAAAALRDADLVLLMVEALKFTDEDEAVLERLRKLDSPVGLAVNKVDLVKDKSHLLPYLEKTGRRHDFAFVVPLSATRGDNCEALEREVMARMPVAAPLYPLDQVTDRSLRFLAAEIVREKLISRLQQEVPYGVAVEIERFDESGDRVEIDAVIWVDRAGHKPIVIGKDGGILKETGREARLELKRLLERPVHLNLWVKVREGWADDERMLRRLGIDA